MDDVSHVVVAIDVGVTQHTVEVLVYGFDDDMRVAGKDGDEGAFRKQHSNLQTEATRESLPTLFFFFLNSANTLQ